MYRENRPKRKTEPKPMPKGRGQGRWRKTRFCEYVARVLCKRAYALEMTLADIARASKGNITQPTLSRVFNGVGSTSIDTLAIVADLLGLEIIIQPKQTKEENTDENQD